MLDFEFYTKSNSMKLQILHLSNALLQAHAFNHLTDKELEAFKKAIHIMSLENLVKTWYKADFFSSWETEKLLMHCNQVLYYMGLPTVNCLVENEFDF